MPVMNEVVVPNFVFKSRHLGDGKLNLSAEDRLDVIDLVYMFEWAFDARRFDALEAIFTDDVVIDHVFGYRQGKEAVMEMMRSVVPNNGLRHQATNPLVFIDEAGNVAVLSYLFVVKVVNDTANEAVLPANLAHALVTDVMRKENGHWKIAQRTFEQMRVPVTQIPEAEQRQYLEPAASQRAVERQA